MSTRIPTLFNYRKDTQYFVEKDPPQLSQNRGENVH